MIFNWQDGFTPFECAMEKERSKIVKYFVEEIKVDTTVFDEVLMYNNLYLAIVCVAMVCYLMVLLYLALSTTNCVSA